MQKSDRSRLHLGEALVLALPFVALIATYGFVTGKIDLSRWPPVVEMRAGLWIPIIFCAIVYADVLLNLYEKRKGDWKWFREGLISAVILVILWCILSPVFEWSVWMAERNKLGLSHP